MIDYSPLFETMKARGVSQYRLFRDGVIDNKTMYNMKRNRNTEMITIERLCLYLDCTPSDIVRIRPDGK